MTGKKQNSILAIAAVLFFCGQALALHQYTPSRRAHHARRRGHLRRIVWNPVFRPSHESLLRQNEEVDRMNLPRIQDDAELHDLIASNALVPIEPTDSLRIDPRLDPERRYCRPWTRDFLQDLSDAYYKEFHDQIQVNSAVRTVKVQHKLRRHNRNAAPEYGETASSHLAGITVDIQRRGMTRNQVKWVEAYMMPLKEQGLIEPEEERHQWVFHVAVSGRYGNHEDTKLLDGGTAASESDNAPVSEPADSPFTSLISDNQ